MVLSWFHFLSLQNIKLHYDSLFQKRENKLTLTCSMLIKCFRLIYIIFAIYYVGESIYSTFQKYREGLIVVAVTEHDYPQHFYPSITFCTKFTDGQKSALLPYYKILYEKAKNSGNKLESNHYTYKNL